MIGVSFQPGSGDYENRQQGPPSSASPVQEAIKVLSLRLPKVVGARSVAPSPLLSSRGSGGSRVDSVVQQIMARMFPTGGAQPGQAPMMPSWSAEFAPSTPSTPDAPRVSGPTASPLREQTVVDRVPDVWRQLPRIISDLSPVLPSGPTGDFAVGPDGRPIGHQTDSPSQPPAMIGQLPTTDPFAFLMNRFQQPSYEPPPEMI